MMSARRHLLKQDSMEGYSKLWIGDSIVVLPFSKSGLSTIFKENLFVQMMIMDRFAFVFNLITAQSRNNKNDTPLTLQEIRDLVEQYLGMNSVLSLEKELSEALDILLDYGLMKAVWSETEEGFRRAFLNKNELSSGLISRKRDVLRKNFLENIREVNEFLYKYIYLEEEGNGQTFWERVNELKKEIAKFLKEQIDSCDLVIPVARKAWVIYEGIRSEDGERQLPEPIYLNPYGTMKIHDYIVEHTKEKLKEKRREGPRRVWLIDDILVTGEQAGGAMKRLNGCDSLPRDMFKVLAFVIDKKKKEEVKDRLGCELLALYECEDMNFYRKILDLLLLIASMGWIIDTDHLIIHGKISPPIDVKTAYEMLEELVGYMGQEAVIREPGVFLGYLHPRRKKFTIDNIDIRSALGELFESLNKIALSRGYKIEDFEISKLRIVFEFDPGEAKVYGLTLAPIINPIIARVREKTEGYGEGNSGKRHSNLLEVARYLIDEKEDMLYGILWPILTSITEKTVTMMKKFFKNVSESIEFELGDVRWIEFENAYLSDGTIKNYWERFKEEVIS